MESPPFRFNARRGEFYAPPARAFNRAGDAAAFGLGLLLLVVPPPPPAGAAADEEAAIVHVLNRLAYGPRPGDVESIRAAGLRTWIEQQLRPERIAERALETRLAALTTLRLSTAEILEAYGQTRDVKGGVGRARREPREQPAPRLGARSNQVVEELQAAKLIRAVHAERQLDELLVDFWMEHFAVDAAKGPGRYLIAGYEREVIRPRAWGKFEDLLRATAESPAMLFSLDNWLSADPSALEAIRSAPGERRRKRPRVPGVYRPAERYGTDAREAPRDELQETLARSKGLDESYAIALLDRHTLGSQGGQTDKDVSELARCLSGWTIAGLRQRNPRFVFEPRLHAAGDKLVLGVPIRAGGRDEGDRALHVLATHPSTARFIALKLARRFVSDQPPSALVERAAETFRSSGGDTREVVRAILESPEFLAPEARGVKVKTPLEFVASAVRAVGAEVEDASGLARRVAELGMPLYLQQPTGRDEEQAWVSPSALQARLAFAFDLAGGKLPGVPVRPEGLAGRPGEVSGSGDALVARLLPGGLSEATRRTLAEQGGDASPARLAGLILGSPEFQRK